MFNIDPNNLPDDMPEEIKDAIIQHQMQHDQIAHEIAGFFDGLDEERLRIMRSFLQMISYSDLPVQVITYYIGICQTMQMKFGKCLGCGEKHDEQAHKMFEEAQKAGEVKVTNPVPDKPLASSDAVNAAQEAYDRNMTFWEMESIPGEQEKIQCKNCGSESPSLADRMLRQPGKGGCHLCVHKEKFGG